MLLEKGQQVVRCRFPCKIADINILRHRKTFPCRLSQRTEGTSQPAGRIVGPGLPAFQETLAEGCSQAEVKRHPITQPRKGIDMDWAVRPETGSFPLIDFVKVLRNLCHQ